jgi:Do/DeqQ family serine protease
MPQTRRPSFAALSALCMLMALGTAPAMAQGVKTAETVTAMPDERVVPATRDQLQLSFAPLVKQATPAVVNIYTRKEVVRSAGPLFNDPFFRCFFGNIGPTQRQEQNSLGSGVIVRSDGLIVTNEHVIQDADEIRVVLSDRREYPAVPVIEDKQTDIAVLRITENLDAPLPTLDLADSDNIEVGDLVLAIGNPFGVGQTVTSGIISALARTDVTGGDFSFFIQTDAAINPGNSGGALLGMDGKLLGINTAIYSRDGGSQGIGFAIPAKLVRTVVLAAEKGGELRRPWIGADGQSVTPDLMRAIGIDRPAGVLLTRVHKGGPVAKAGLEIGDVILEVDGNIIDDPKALRFRVAILSPDVPVELVYWRDGKRVKSKLVPVLPPFDPAPDQTLLGGQHPFSGAAVANLSPGLAEQISFDGEPDGVVIVEIQPRSIARQVGFKVGDVVLSINGNDIHNVDEMAALVRRTSNVWDISLRRGDRILHAVLQ